MVESLKVYYETELSVTIPYYEASEVPRRMYRIQTCSMYVTFLLLKDKLDENVDVFVHFVHFSQVLRVGRSVRHIKTKIITEHTGYPHLHITGHIIGFNHSFRSSHVTHSIIT